MWPPAPAHEESASFEVQEATGLEALAARPLRRGPLGLPLDAVAKDRRSAPVLRVLLLGGATTTFKWTSFTQRGRQLARGLRQLGPVLGADARAWNTDCRAWCSAPPNDGWSPSVIVHVKYVCSCALRLWRDAAHIAPV